MDILPYKEKHGEAVLIDLDKERHDLKRKFSVQAFTDTSIYCLKIEDLAQMKTNFPDDYHEIFRNSLVRLKKAMKLRR